MRWARLAIGAVALGGVCAALGGYVSLVWSQYRRRSKEFWEEVG